MADMETDQTQEQKSSEPAECETGTISRFRETFREGRTEISNSVDVECCGYRFQITGQVSFEKTQMSALVKITSVDYMWPVSLQWGLAIFETPGRNTKHVRDYNSPAEAVMSAGEISCSTKPLTKNVNNYIFKYFIENNADVKMKWFVKITKASFSWLEEALKREQRKILRNHYYAAKVMKSLTTKKPIEQDADFEHYIMEGGVE